MNRYTSSAQAKTTSVWQTLLTGIFVAVFISSCGAAAPAATEPPELPVTNCETLLPPQACDPGWLERIEYVSLNSLPTGDCPERLLDGGQCNLYTFSNKGQEFTIRVEGLDPNLLNEYVSNAQVYFEVQRAGISPPIDPGFPSLVTILLESIVEVTGTSIEDWSMIRDSMLEEREAKEQTITLAEIIALNSEAGVLEEVIIAANSRAESEYKAIGADTSNIPAIIDFLMNQPGAPILVNPASLPSDDAAYNNILTNNPAGLVVTMDWSSAPQEDTPDLWVIWFSIDPPLPPKRADSNVQVPTPTPSYVGPYAYIYYKEKCSVYSASVQIRAKTGSMTNSFWRKSPYQYVGSRTANIMGTALPPSLSHNSYPTRVAYDTQVKGGAGGGKYWIYGGWVQGSGC